MRYMFKFVKLRFVKIVKCDIVLDLAIVFGPC